MRVRALLRCVPLRCVLLLCALLVSGCAWSNRANRPVWNAFEAHLVPEDDAAFFATLPLTVPGGLVSILADTFIVHPAQVVDDAWGDAGDIWRKIDWKDGYYTQLAALPWRVLATPLVFVGAFLGRSLFDIAPYTAKGEDELREIEGERQRALLARLTAIAQATPDSGLIKLSDLASPQQWTVELEQAFTAALAQGRALDRLALYTYARLRKLPPWRADPLHALRDREPVVRYLVLDAWPDDLAVPDDLKTALRADPDEAVRQLACQLWP